jgi:tetratricopeptide (TPR) repeat protein
MHDDDAKQPAPAAGRVLSIAERIERKRREQLRAQAAKLHVRELEATVEWIDMTKDLEAMDLDGEIDALAGDDTAEARRQRGEMRSMRALQRCLRGEVDAGYAEWAEVAQEVPNLSLPHLMRARWQMNTDPEGALAHFDRAAEAEPRDANVYWRRGDCYVRLKDHERALANYRRALALDPESIDGLHQIGKTLTAIGQLEEAVRYYDQAIALAPRYADFYMSRAIALEVLDEYASAIRDYDRILELNPDNLAARFGRARCRAEAGELDLAAQELEAIADREPDTAEIPRLHGKVLVQMKRWDAAIEQLSRAVTLAPDHDESWGQRSLARLHKGDKAGALADITRALELAPTAQHYVFMDITLRHGDRDADKLAALDDAIARLPNGDVLRVERAKLHAKLGDHERALADWDTLIASYPGDVDCRVGRTRALSMLTRHAEAVEEATRVIERDPDNAAAHALRANNREHLDEDEALIDADWDRAVALGPTDIAIAYYHGQYLLNKGAYTRAIADFDRLIACSPKFAEAYYLRAYCRYRLDEERFDDDEWVPDDEETAARCRECVADLERALELGHRDPDVYFELFWYHRDLGDLAAARAAIDSAIAAEPDAGMYYRLRWELRREMKDEAGAEEDRLRAEALMPGSTT